MDCTDVHGLRIACLTTSYPPDPGPAAAATGRIVRSLVDQGADVVVFTSITGPASAAAFRHDAAAGVTAGGGVPRDRVASEAAARDERARPRVYRVFRIAEGLALVALEDTRRRFDVFHGVTLPAAGMCLSVPGRDGRPVVASVIEPPEAMDDTEWRPVFETAAWTAAEDDAGLRAIYRRIEQGIRRPRLQRTSGDRNHAAATGIVSFDRSQSKSGNGSTRIRVAWPLRYWPDAEEAAPGRTDYDAIIFQKAYWPAYAAECRGVRILDLCDPDFLEKDNGCAEMIAACDAITCSTEALTQAVSELTRKPAMAIPDRIDFATIDPHRKVHRGQTRSVVWFGNPQNLPLLETIEDALIDLRIEQLTIVSGEGARYELPRGRAGTAGPHVVHKPWDADSICRELLEADVVLNPRSEQGLWKFKSNNKTLLAWALGLPVARNGDELQRLMTEDSRREESDRRYDEVRRDYDVRDTVADYRAFIDRLGRRRSFA